MIQKYNNIAIIYGGSGKGYASALHKKIKEISKKERYPLSSSIIMDNLLTGDLLGDVMGIIRRSEICVIFLTADDKCETEKGGRKRLRQNVVFELGMALISLGRKHCIFLSDFDIRSNDFELPSDMTSLEIKQFSPDDLDEILEKIIDKILRIGRETASIDSERDIEVKYDRLFLRDSYYIEYADIFKDRSGIEAEGARFFTETLTLWLNECGSLPNYDEKCIYLLERIGFLPIFGRIPEVEEFLADACALVEDYHDSDVEYYHETEILDFVKNLLACILKYTLIKTVYEKPDRSLYKDLADDFLSETIPEQQINPLISVTYFDYLGLTYLKLYDACKEEKYLDLSVESFEAALKYVRKVDMGLKIWAGFIYYNLGRAYFEKGMMTEAGKSFDNSIRIRKKWTDNSKYNITVRNAMSSEYFVALISRIDMQKKNGIIGEEESQKAYRTVKDEMNKYSSIDEKADRMVFLRKLLDEKIKKA